MTSLIEQCDQLVFELLHNLHESHNRPAIVEVDEIAQHHSKLSLLHTDASKIVKGLSGYAHRRAALRHANIAQGWQGIHLRSALISTFGEQKSLQWVLLNYDDDDNGGVTRAMMRKSNSAIYVSTKITRWGEVGVSHAEG